jgi:alanine racemase
MRTTQAIINLNNLRYNLAELRRLAPGTSIIAIVKANAYGHGIVEISSCLEKEGVELLGVAFPEEGIKIRKAGIKTPILVLIPAPKEDAALFSEYDLQTVVNSYELMKSISDEAIKRKVIVRAHLFINTGMNRDGINPEDAIKYMDYISKLKGLKVIGLCTHFATSEIEDSQMVLSQLARFNNTIIELKETGYNFEYIHASNSGGVINYPEAHFNTIRPGISLYGYNLTKKQNINLHPVMELKTKVLAIRHLSPGETVGYGMKYIANRDTAVAIIPVGYSDGYFYSLNSKATCLIKGREYNLIGSVCMDQSMVEIGFADIKIDDEVVLIGHQGEQSILITELAQKAGTIPYEILTAIADRIPRVYF